MDGASSLAAMRERGGAAARRRLRGGGIASAPPASGLASDAAPLPACADRAAPHSAPAWGPTWGRGISGGALSARALAVVGRGSGGPPAPTFGAALPDFAAMPQSAPALGSGMSGGGAVPGPTFLVTPAGGINFRGGSSETGVGLTGVVVPRSSCAKPPARLSPGRRRLPYPAGSGLGRTVAAAGIRQALSGFASSIAVVSHSPQSILRAAKPRIPPKADISASTGRGTALAPRKAVIGQLNGDFAAAVRQTPPCAHPCGRRS